MQGIWLRCGHIGPHICRSTVLLATFSAAELCFGSVHSTCCLQTSLGGHPEPSSKITTSQSILNLANCILGAGVLGYPFCFKSCGFVLGTLMMLVTLAATRISYQLLLYCSQLSGRRTYEGIAEQSMGKRGRLILELFTAALNLGCIVAYLNILADILSSVAGTIIPPGAEPSRSAYLTGEDCSAA